MGHDDRQGNAGVRGRSAGTGGAGPVCGGGTDWGAEARAEAARGRMEAARVMAMFAANAGQPCPSDHPEVVDAYAGMQAVREAAAVERVARMRAGRAAGTFDL